MKFSLLLKGHLALALTALAMGAYANANIDNGKAIDRNSCYGCHAKKSGFGNGDMIYLRSDSKVSSLVKLKTMVERCNTELRLDLFPEDEADVTAYLNQQFYKFKP